VSALTRAAPDPAGAARDAERAVLGACLLGKLDLVAEYRAALPGNPFADPRHGTLWRAIGTLADQGVPPDPVTVPRQVQDAGDLWREPADRLYVHELYEHAPMTAGTGPHHARIVREHALARRVEEVGTRLTQIGRNIDLGALDDTLAQVRRELDQLAGSANGQAVNDSRLRATAASQYLPRSSRWLWEHRIPQSGITLLAGREGIGKSNWDALLAARVTQGRMPGCHIGAPKSVGIVATEDAWEEVIVPRLMAAGADRDRVFNIEANVTEGTFGTISLPADVDHLPALCVKNDIALLILDPIMSVIHGSLDTHHDREARKALDPLANFARTEGVAIVANIHVNKSATNDALNSIMASRAFTAVARSVLYCVVDPEVERGDRYLLGHPKCNIGPKQPMLQYHLVTARIDQPDESISTSRVVVDGDDPRSLDTLMESREHRQRPGPTSAVPGAVRTYLSQRGFPASIKEISDAIPGESLDTVRKQLVRMANRGELVRPGGVSGLYALPSPTGSTVLVETTESTVPTDSGGTVGTGQLGTRPARAGTHARARKRQDPPAGFDWDTDAPEPPDEE